MSFKNGKSIIKKYLNKLNLSIWTEEWLAEYGMCTHVIKKRTATMHLYWQHTHIYLDWTDKIFFDANILI